MKVKLLSFLSLAQGLLVLFQTSFVSAANPAPLIDVTEISSPINLRFCPSKGVSIYLYTRNNPIVGKVLRLNSGWLHSHFNKDLPTKVIIHGWFSSQFTPSIAAMRKAYLHNIDCNVLMVDWSPGSMTGDYPHVFHHVHPTATVVAYALNRLIDLGYLDPNKVTILGHSLGAQIAGSTGSKVTSGQDQILHIIGLDPATKFFNVNDPDDVLDPSDAQTVQGIHTGASGNIGTLPPVGSLDYYPHFGHHQPSCPFDISGMCSHYCSVRYSAEIAAGLKYKADKCTNFAEIAMDQCNVVSSGHFMGDDPSNLGKTGVYHVEVNAHPPYANTKPDGGLIPAIFIELINTVVGIVIFIFTFLRASFKGLQCQIFSG